MPKTIITRRSRALQFGDPPFEKGLSAGQIITEAWSNLYVRVDDEWYPIKGKPKIYELTGGERNQLTIRYRTSETWYRKFRLAMQQAKNGIEPRSKDPIEALTHILFGFVGVFEDAYYSYLKPAATSFVFWALGIFLLVNVIGLTVLINIVDDRMKQAQLDNFTTYLETREYIDKEIDKSHKFDPTDIPEIAEYDVTQSWVVGDTDIWYGPNGQPYQTAPGWVPKDPTHWKRLERPLWYIGPVPTKPKDEPLETGEE